MTLGLDAGSATALLLHLTRLSAGLVPLPIPGSRPVPRAALAGLALWSSIALVRAPVTPPQSLAILGVLLAGEVVIGLCFAFTLRLAFLPLEIVGTLGAQEAALTMPATLDPSTSTPEASLETLLKTFAVLGFLAFGGIEAALALLDRSFAILPVGGVESAFRCLEVAEAILDFAGRLLIVSLELAIPIFASSALAISALMVMARALPRLNLLTDALPLRTASACLAVGVTLPLCLRVLNWSLGQSLSVFGAS
ncbi:MAG: flagellar biosynthetic protein FliR [Planctomycetes bacterium]|nr:flagellar biosynthetic protein FliR [Planctomycetota bacterium]